MEEHLLLILLGIVVGAYGTLIGAGGGFILVPLLLLIYPHDRPLTITTISLAVVFFNALSGTAAYTRMGRVDYKSGLIFASAAIPGSIVGVFATGVFARGPFDMLLGVLLLVVSLWVVIQPTAPETPAAEDSAPNSRVLTDAAGTTYRYTVNRNLGIAISVLVGFLSSLLGIGGGIIHVPAMVQVLGFPPHVATATSHFVLSLTSLTGSVTHALHGDFARTLPRVIPLSIGVIVGAQAGAALSARLHGRLIVRLLAVALALVGVRLIVGAITG
ncbi:MAG TPA: sulfite exporter TauE/SafE family protein [Chloroflexota bacterium]|nr:sulfite exporter TauE/SafE family protein [Chloroflexota bacterium]